MEGASNKVIALKLVMTKSTVKVHMKTILRKLRLENRTQAAIWARDHANELACDRGTLERTGFGPTIEPRPRATANVDSCSCGALGLHRGASARPARTKLKVVP